MELDGHRIQTSDFVIARVASVSYRQTVFRNSGLKLEQKIYLLLYRFGPSSKQNERVKVASSSKNSVAKASHQRLSLS